jgi:tetratricopeptide (TPR) repeat protein/transcriptional regulator with XRE-family HTH domain
MGPVARLAFELREMRRRAGGPSYRELARLARYSASTLSTAASGRTMPTREVTRAFAQACGEDAAEWEERWREAALSLGACSGGDQLPGAGALGARPWYPAPWPANGMGGPAENLTVPAMLPPDVTDFTGRSESLQLADLQLCGSQGEREQAPLLTIAGPPGIGKTAFALRLAHSVKRRFRDGQLYASFRGDEGDHQHPNEILARFLRALGVPRAKVPAGLEEQSALFRSVLAGRHVLVVLDNVVNEAQVRPLLPASDTCRTLITSRSVLSGLECSQTIFLDTLTEPEAVSLLAGIAGRARVAGEPGAARDLAELCGRLPLAIRIAGARLKARPTRTVADLARRLRHEQRRLGELTTGDLEVRSAFASSYERLSADLRFVFRRLGLIPGLDFTAETAAALFGPVSGDTEASLELLADYNLVQAAQERRYRLHCLLRIYACERAEAEDTEREREEAISGLVNWYLHTAMAASGVLFPHRRRVPAEQAGDGRPPLAFATHREALDWCEAELPNLVAVSRYAAETGRCAVAWKLPACLLGFFTLRKYWNEWTSSFLAGLTAARQTGDRTGEALILSGLGIACRELRRFDEAFGYLEDALAIHRETGDLYGEASALNSIGAIHLGVRQFDKAIVCYERVIDVCHRTGNRWGESTTLNNLSEAFSDIGRFGDAAECSRQALELSGGIGNRWGEGFALYNLATSSRGLGRPQEAVRSLEKSLVIRREIGDRQGEAQALRCLGDALFDIGEPEQARESWHLALAIFTQIGDPQGSDESARLSRLGRLGAAAGTGPAAVGKAAPGTAAAARR